MQDNSVRNVYHGSMDSRTTTLPTYVDTNDIMQLLGVPRSTLEKWRAQGTFPSGHKLPNGRLVWPLETVTGWVESLPARRTR